MVSLCLSIHCLCTLQLVSAFRNLIAACICLLLQWGVGVLDAQIGVILATVE